MGDWVMGKCEGTGDNKECGPGSQKKTRTCVDGTEDKCTASDRETVVSCMIGDCEKQHGEWKNEGDCEAINDKHKKCGPAMQQQTRSCTDGTTDKCTLADRSRTTPCQLKDCLKQLGEWTDAGKCEAIEPDKKDCGQGFQRQTRMCSDGTNDPCTATDTEKKIPCTLKACAKRLGIWENDGICESTIKGKTCGPGFLRQKRTCVDGTNEKCTASEKEKRIPCKLRDCVKELGTWENIGVCEGIGENKDCGPGQQRQKRKCSDGTADKCAASDREQMVACSLPKCPSIEIA